MSTDTEPSQRELAIGALRKGKEFVTPALRGAVDTLPEPIRPIACYHFGWQDEHGAPSTADTGKALRPTLTVLTAELLGGTPADAVPAAVAVELVHNFSLLHDDIMDGDTHRRHRPTAWTVFGSGAAILAGDALSNLATHTLALSKHPAVTAQLRILTAAVHDLLAGQGFDLEFESRSVITESDYRAMAQRKTAALLAASSAVGGLAAQGGAEQVEHLYAFGEHLGLAFQFVDDMLGIWGDPAVTGKPVGNDIRRRKKSLPVVLALTAGTAAAEHLAALYHRERPFDDADVHRAVALIEDTGARTATQQRADAELTEALRHLDAAGAQRSTAEVRGLARFLAHRDR